MIPYAVLLAFAFVLAGPQHAGARFLDPLYTPASPVGNLAQVPFMAIAHAGSHLVVVGSRGVIMLSRGMPSAEAGWIQAAVPAQSDLVAVQFLNAQEGWACGFDGTILKSIDGGMTWVKILDGWSAKASFEHYYQAALAAGDHAASAGLAETKLNFGKGPSLPWLGIWFATPQTGYAVGPFGNIAMTSDGGKTWTPWFSHIDNANFYNLNAITGIGPDIYIAGEEGMIYRLDQAHETFVQQPTGYTGSFFGIVGTPNYLIAYGLRGTIYRSTNHGESWNLVRSPSADAIVGATILPDGTLALATVGGKLLCSHDDGQSFRVEASDAYIEYADITSLTPGSLLAATTQGLRTIKLPSIAARGTGEHNGGDRTN